MLNYIKAFSLPAGFLSLSVRTIYVGKYNLGFCGCGAEHSCRFLNKAKRKVKKQKNRRKLNRWVQSQERAHLNLETTLSSSFLRLIGQWESPMEGQVKRWGLRVMEETNLTAFLCVSFPVFFLHFLRRSREERSMSLDPRVQGQETLNRWRERNSQDTLR